MGETVRPEELMARALPVVDRRHDQAWLVGGWVRDRLLGVETHDYDFVVPSGAIATAREIGDALGGAFVLLDAERDTARVLVGPPSEVTCFDFAGLRAPEIGADLLARDFTVNAMAVPAAAWNRIESALIDPAGGRCDLAQRLLRAVSADSFREDPLRMLRAVRLRASLGLHIESQTAVWVQRDAELLDAVSRERVRDEIAQIVFLPPARESLQLLADLNLLEQVMPEVARLRGVVPGAGQEDALGHALQTVEAAEAIRLWLEGEVTAGGPQFEALAAALSPYRTQLADHLHVTLPGGRTVGVLLMMAALLHNSGQGAAGRPQANEGERVLAREVLGASIAATVMRRLCFSSAETVRVRLSVRSHARPRQLAEEADGAPSRRAIYRFFRDAEPGGVETVLLSLSGHMASDGSLAGGEAWRGHLAAAEALLRAYYERRDDVVSPPRLLDGRELMAALDLAPGPQVGGLLEDIREAQAAGEVTSAGEALALAKKLLATGGPL